MKFAVGNLFIAVLLCVATAYGSLVITSPSEGEAVCLMNDGYRAFVARDAKARREMFLNKAWRHQAVAVEKSLPKPVAIAWQGAVHPAVQVTVARTGATEPWFTATVTGAEVVVWNLEIARTYRVVVRDGADEAVRTFRTQDLAPRALWIPGVPNFRDVGGWHTKDGRRVRQGLLYRSQGLNDNALFYLTSDETLALYKAGQLEARYGKDGRKIRERIDRNKGKVDFDPQASWMRKSLPRSDPKPGKARLDAATQAYLIHKLGIRTDIDLRRPGEVWGMKASPLGPDAQWLNYPIAAYGGMADADSKKVFSKVFRTLLDARNYPADIHCIGGADRTGCAVFLLNGLLGVPEDDLMKDWELTAFTYESQAFGHASRIDKFLKVLDAAGGATMQEKCAAFVKSLGFSDTDIATFRTIMLED